MKTSRQLSLQTRYSPTHPGTRGRDILLPLQGTGLRQRKPSRQWQEQLYRGKLRPFQQMNKECASRAVVTSLGRRGQGASE